MRMSWRYRLRVALIRVLQVLCSSVVRWRAPAHVALVMDGNRRYARRTDVGLEVGYRRGFDKLMTVNKWCTLVGVRELTVYAFSLENFKRSAGEVAAVMRLAEEKFQHMLSDLGELNSWGIRIRVMGRSELLSPQLQALSARIALATRNNDKLLLNIAFPYTGRDEISRAASFIVDAVKAEELSAEEVDPELVSCALELSCPQLLVRTSGEGRLSDYMLWQVSNTVLYFTSTLWPEFSIVDLLKALFHFVRYAPVRPAGSTKITVSSQRQQFLDNLQRRRWQKLEKFSA